MAIFAVLESENVVQVGDRTRLSAFKTYSTPDESPITLVEIRPSATDPYVNVTAPRFLDWQYSSAGTKTVDLRVTTAGAPTLISKTIASVTAADDNLFSTDFDITAHETDVLKYTQAGRNSHIDKHRAAQARIMTSLDEMRVHAQDGDRLTKADVKDIQELKDWSKFLTLQIIFEGLSNAVDDVFMRKAKTYQHMADIAKQRAVLRFDFNQDGTLDVSENTDMASYRVVRR